MSVVATGALNGTGMPLSSGMLAALSAAVAQGWGDKDIGELADSSASTWGRSSSRTASRMPIADHLLTPLIALPCGTPTSASIRSAAPCR